MIFRVIVSGRWFLRVVWSCANSFSASLSQPLVLGVWPDGGLDDRVQVLTRGMFVVIVFSMEVAS